MCLEVVICVIKYLQITVEVSCEKIQSFYLRLIVYPWLKWKLRGINPLTKASIEFNTHADLNIPFNGMKSHVSYFNSTIEGVKYCWKWIWVASENLEKLKYVKQLFIPNTNCEHVHLLKVFQSC